MLYYNGKGRYERKYGELWKSLVPKSGQAGTVQGELVRAIGRIADEAYRNGYMNWDEGYRILLAFLRKHLVNPGVFAATTLVEIEEDLDAMENMANGTDPLDYPEDEDAYDRITDRVVEWCDKHPDPIVHPTNPKLSW